MSARGVFLSLVLIPALAAPCLAGSPVGSPAWVREQEALRQAEGGRQRGRKPAPVDPDAAPMQEAPQSAAGAPPPDNAESVPPSGETVLVEPPTPAPNLPLPEIAPSANPLSRLVLESLGAFRQRPLFAPSRRRPDQPAAFIDTPPPPPPEAPESPPPELRLVGIVAGVDRAVALVSRHEGASMSLRIGDRVESWRVERIAPDRVVLREGEREQTYRLFALPPATVPGERLPAEAVVRAP